MSRQLRDESPDELASAREIVSSILESGDLARLVEVYYFSLEPGLFGAVRWLASLSEDSRRQLGKFVEVVGTHDVHIERPDPTTLVIKLTPR